MVKVSSKCGSSRHSKLLRSSRNCIRVVSKYPNLLSHRSHKISPSSNNILPEVDTERCILLFSYAKLLSNN